MYWTSLAIDSADTPFVAYEDAASSNRATVMKFNGTDWVTVGTTGFSPGVVWWNSMAIDATGVPYAAFQDGANWSKAIAMKYW